MYMYDFVVNFVFVTVASCSRKTSKKIKVIFECVRALLSVNICEFLNASARTPLVLEWYRCIPKTQRFVLYMYRCCSHFSVATLALFWLAGTRGKSRGEKATAGHRVLIRRSVGLCYQRAPCSLPMTANVIPKLIFPPWYLAVSLIRLNYVYWAPISCSQPAPFHFNSDLCEAATRQMSQKCRH